MASASMSGDRQEAEAQKSGPFITISRQYGCYGFSLGLLLLDILNESARGGNWQIYHKEILARLASETNLATDYIEEQRRSKPSMLAELFRSLKRSPGKQLDTRPITP